MKSVFAVALLGVLLAVVPGMAQSAGDPSINAILNAPNASAAVNAYAQATRLGSDLPTANKAFVAKMADLGQPKLAFQQAIDVVQEDPTSGLAWGVMAYTYADRESPFNAFTDLLQAARFAPDNPFVVRTAGQLLAWFDSDKMDRDTLSDPLRANVGALKIRYGDNQMFLAAYNEAAATYASVAAPEQPPPAEAPPAAAYAYPDQGNYEYDYAPPVFSDYYPDLYADYGYGLPWCWNPCWGGDYLGASCGFGNGFGFGRHHGGHGFGHGFAGAGRSGAFGAGSFAGTGRSGAFGAGRLAAAPGARFAGGRTAGTFRTGRGASTFGTAAAPPGVAGGGFRSLTTSGGYPSRFSVWHSGSSPSGSIWSTRGTLNRSAGLGGQAHYWTPGTFARSPSRGYSLSTGSRSYGGIRTGASFRSGGAFRSGGSFRSGGGFRSSGGFHGGGGGGGGFHGGGGGHGGGGHR